MEIALLDYRGTINKNVEYKINEDRSGIYLKGFRLGAQDIADIKNEIVDDAEFLEFKVEDILQYESWGWGNSKKGAGQLGIYKLKDQKGNIYFSVIKDYIAFEGDWRIHILMLESSELRLKNELAINKLGIPFAEYILGKK